MVRIKYVSPRNKHVDRSVDHGRPPTIHTKKHSRQVVLPLVNDYHFCSLSPCSQAKLSRLHPTLYLVAVPMSD